MDNIYDVLLEESGKKIRRVIAKNLTKEKAYKMYQKRNKDGNKITIWCGFYEQTEYIINSFSK